MINQIHSCDELLNINRKGNYILSDDLDFEGKIITKIIGDFSGTIDGAGHFIKNITIEDEIWGDEQTIALFLSMNRAKISNISFENINIKIDNTIFKPHIGVLGGCCSDSVIENVKVISYSNLKKLPLIYETNNCQITNCKLLCNGEEMPIVKYK